MEISNLTAEQIIKKLNLSPLPMEGGWFFETWKSEIKAQTPSTRSAGTCIYYLLKQNGLSSWHQVKSDEFWLYHGGAPSTQLLLFPDGTWEERKLGANLADGELPQSLIPAGVWQAAKPLKSNEYDYSLFSAVVVPGFEFEDYLQGDAKELTSKWPDAAEKIMEYA